MAAAQPQHPLAVFRLEPLNDRARNVVRDPSNAHFVSGSGSDTYLDIGGIPSPVNDGVTLATLGRHGDIHIAGATVARVQCAFEIDRDSRVVMLYDKSHNHSTQVHTMDNDGTVPGASAPEVFPFEYGRPRKVCVGPFINPILGMCGVRLDLILFRLIWPKDHARVLARRAQRYDVASPDTVAHLAKTLDDTETAPESMRSTRIHTPAHGDAKIIRYQRLDPLGEGAFGVVHRVLNVDTGRFMALKLLKRSTNTTHSEKCQREVKILSQIKHTHILDLIWSQRWDKPEAEIFSGLKDGTLKTLVGYGSYADNMMSLMQLANRMCHHMLQALDALAFGGIVHRDLKPENIFYVQRQGTFDFQLGDFGLSNHTQTATSGQVGTMIFMAPEMYSGSGTRTHKVDVWSLFVTLIWTLNVCGFHHALPVPPDPSPPLSSPVQPRPKPSLGMAVPKQKPETDSNNWLENGKDLQQMRHMNRAAAVFGTTPFNFIAGGPLSDVKMHSDTEQHKSPTDVPGGHWAAQ